MENLLSTLNEIEKQSIILKIIKKDEIIYEEGETCKEICIVKRGKIKISSFLENGQEIIFNVLRDGDLFGNNLIFSSNPQYKGDVISLEESELYLIRKEALINILQSNKSFLIDYLQRQSDFGKSLNGTIKLLTFNNAIDRLYYFLEVNNNNLEYKTITDLANELYLSREVLSRLLSKLKKEGEIIVKDKHIIKMI